jgi:DNA-binding response OmpR family regulator
LVVEDEFLVSLAMIDLLEGLGCVIVGPAVRVAVALQLAQTESLDAAVLDIDIAGEMVWPVAEELQRRNVPFLFLSACRQWNTVPAVFAATPHFEKPLEQNRLLLHLGAIWAG